MTVSLPYEGVGTVVSYPAGQSHSKRNQGAGIVRASARRNSQVLIFGTWPPSRACLATGLLSLCSLTFDWWVVTWGQTVRGWRRLASAALHRVGNSTVVSSGKSGKHPRKVFLPAVLKIIVSLSYKLLICVLLAFLSIVRLPELNFFWKILYYRPGEKLDFSKNRTLEFFQIP